MESVYEPVRAMASRIFRRRSSECRSSAFDRHTEVLRCREADTQGRRLARAVDDAGHLAARNRIGRLRLGVGVTDAGRRNPAVTAQAAATLHLLTRGQAILGIGTGEREGNEPYGVDWSRPVARFEEAIATIRALWDSGGELVTRDSPYFPVAQRCVRPAPLPREVAGNLDRRPRAEHAAGYRALRRRLVSRD